MSGVQELPNEEGAPDAPAFTPWSRIAFVVGSLGLLGAMATDALAVVGRHLQLPVLGSVELVQAFVVVAASAAMVSATMARQHASVRVLSDRARGAFRTFLTSFGNLACAIFFGVLAFGSGWIVWDLRNGAEQTELLQIPLLWLRAIWLICAVICCAIFLRRTLQKPRASE